MNQKYNCPECGSNEFVTEPNQYDVLTFTKNGFQIESSEQVDGSDIFCRECGEQVDCIASTNQIVIKNKHNKIRSSTK